MTEDEFWEIIVLVDWPGLVDAEAVHGDGHDAVILGKNRLLDLLPTEEALEGFQSVFSQVCRRMFDKFRSWSDTRVANPADSWQGWGTGDDSFSDLVCHIVGCGKETYEAELADPNLAVERVDRQYAKWANKTPQGQKPSDGFVESFSYCFPHEEDYDTPENKLKKAEEELATWITKAAGAYNDPGGRAEQQVAALMVTVDHYRNKVANKHTKPEVIFPTQEEIGRYLKQARIAILKSAFAQHAKIKIDIVYKMRLIEEELHSLGE